MTFLIFGLLNYSILHQIKYPKLGQPQKIRHGKQKPLLLFSCLDWGFGHTTRSIPLMLEFQAQGCDLIVACNSTQKKILASELRDVRYVDLEGYDIIYGDSSGTTRFKIASQFRKILTRINMERHWLQHILHNHNNIAAVVSDNRYGLALSRVPCILITHQLFVRSGYGRLIDNLLQRYLFTFVNRFSECWIPDHSSIHSLAGELSHPKYMPRVKVKYIGPVTRFTGCNSLDEFIHDVVVILSGPEPQRTILENIVLRDIKNLRKKVVVVRGLPDTQTDEVKTNAEIYNYLDASALNRIVCESRYVVCRPGYTSIMDMVKLKKKMIVVPTPGQGEQEYLAKHLSSKHLALAVSQINFSLPVALDQAQSFSFKFLDDTMQNYKNAIAEFVSGLTSLSLSSQR